MAKRKEPDTAVEDVTTPTKRRLKTKSSQKSLTNGIDGDGAGVQSPAKAKGSPRKKKSVEGATPRKNGRASGADRLLDGEEGESADVTPKPNGRTLFATPKKSGPLGGTPSKSKRADRSAKRKSVQALADQRNEDDWEGQEALARQILDEDEDGNGVNGVDDPEGNVEHAEADTTPAQTPTKRGRGRPKGAKNKRSPTPEGDIQPEERYFFQNRAGPPQISNNKFNIKLLGHDEYLKHVATYKDPHEPEQKQLMKLHARSFPQWRVELQEGFSICLYGYGSKRSLVTNFATYLHTHSSPRPKIVIVNGYTPKLSIKSIFSTVATALYGEDHPVRLIGQPSEVLDALLAHISSHPPRASLLLAINSLDAAPLRSLSTQSLLSALSTSPHIHLLATTDSPMAPTLYSSTTLSSFRFVYHDATTFAPYSLETNPVDDVHELLGRRKARLGGRDGMLFVLRSLPENARNLYRVLLSEILAILDDDVAGATTHINNGDDEDDHDEGANGARRASKRPATEAAADEVGIEYRALYQKATEEFIANSVMNFQFLLKEFHDHQMITSRRDAGGTELLSVPLGREDMQAVLEELVL